MASPIATLFDKRRMAVTRARFKAWWDGADFDEAEALAAVEQDVEPTGADEELFDLPEAPPPPRILALSLLWGEGRIMPGDAAAEAAAAGQLHVSAQGRIAVLGPGHAQPLVSFSAAHPGEINGYEWRDETVDALTAALRNAKLGPRVTAARIDLETHHFEAESVDGVLSLDEFTYADEPTRLAHHIAKMLKPGACVVADFYAGLPSPDIAPAFASAFAEPHIRAAGDVAHYLMEAGLKIESQDDITDAHMELSRQGFKNLEGALKAKGGVDVSVARELSWEAEAWRTRLKLLGARRLERRRVIARRPA